MIGWSHPRRREFAGRESANGSWQWRREGARLRSPPGGYNHRRDNPHYGAWPPATEPGAFLAGRPPGGPPRPIIPGSVGGGQCPPFFYMGRCRAFEGLWRALGGLRAKLPKTGPKLTISACLPHLSGKIAELWGTYCIPRTVFRRRWGKFSKTRPKIHPGWGKFFLTKSGFCDILPAVVGYGPTKKQRRDNDEGPDHNQL